MFSRCLLKRIINSTGTRRTILNRSIVTASSLVIDQTISSSLKDEMVILPVDTSVFMFNDDIEENIRFIRSQMEIGKKSHVHVVPCALINGKIKVGLNKDDFYTLRNNASDISECTISCLEKMMENQETAYFTTSVLSLIANLLKCPVAATGFVRGLEKDSPSTSQDIESLRKYHITNVSCGFDVTSDIYSTVPFLISNEISVVTPGCQYMTSVNNRLLKVKSNITTYSFAELATLLLNNEQMQYPSSYMVGIHIKDTTRTAKLEKLMPSVIYESQRKVISNDDRSRFIHNCLNEKSNGLSKNLFISCMKEVTRAGVSIVKCLKEQENILHIKSLLNEEHSKQQESNEISNQPITTIPDMIVDMKEENKNNTNYITLFNSVNISSSSPNPSDSFPSSSFFTSALPSPSTIEYHEYTKDSPVLIGEIGTGVYHQDSSLSSRPASIFEDVGGVMRTIYEVLLRHNPVKRPYLIGVVGNDENGKKVLDYHKQMGDKLEGVRISNGKTTQICGIYSKEGLCEKEYRLKDTIEGVEVTDIEKNRERIVNASLVCLDTSLPLSSMTKVNEILAKTNNPLLVDPSHSNHYSGFLQSGLLSRTDFLLPSLNELWNLACVIQPSIESSLKEWNELINQHPSLPFQEAILHLRSPLKCIMKEMKGDKDHFVILKMNRMGMAMICQNQGEEDMDVIHFNIDQSFTPTFESHIADEEAFTGGLLYGLLCDYPMNLSMALGINTLRVNSRQKRIVADSINDSIHNHFIKSYMKQLWG